MCFSFIPYIEHLSTTEVVLVLILTLAMAFVVIVVSIALVLRKIYLENVQKRKASLEELYRDLILNYLFCDFPYDLPKDDIPRAPRDLRDLIEPIEKHLSGDKRSKRNRHFHVIKLILLDYSRYLVGETRARLILLFHELGYVMKEMDLLQSRKWWIRAEAARNLAMMGARVATKPLLRATVDPHPDVRTEAIQALFDLMQEDALPQLLPLLKNISQWMAIRLSGNILKLKGRAIPSMLDGLERREHSVQLLLIDLLGEIKDLRAYDQMEAMTAEGDPKVRVAALVALGKLGDARGEAHLIKALTDPDPAIRLGAATGLKHLASPSSVTALQRALNDEVFEIRYNVAHALSLCGEPGRNVLVEAMEGDHSDVKKIAEEFLDELGYFDGYAVA